MTPESNIATNTPTNRYGSIAAEIYDIDKPYFALADTAFHIDRLASVTGPILEPACGSGRTLIPLVEAGHEVAGFDPSPEMLDRCRARLAERGLTADLSDQTMEGFAYDRHFAAIVLPAATITLIDHYAVAMAVLQRFHDALAPGGLLILDSDPLSYLAHQGEDVRRWTAPNGDLLTLHGRRTLTDWVAQRSESQIRYERWRDNRLIESQLEPMAQRFWGLEELTMALQSVGFAEVSVTGGYKRRPPRARDAILTYEAIRD
jgi:SAM-dependent methyltransferase